MNKKIILWSIVLVLLVGFASQISAYTKLCLTKGESIPPGENPVYTCGHDRCDVCVNDDYYAVHPAKCNEITQCVYLSEPEEEPTTIPLEINGDDGDDEDEDEDDEDIQTSNSNSQKKTTSQGIGGGLFSITGDSVKLDDKQETKSNSKVLIVMSFITFTEVLILILLLLMKKPKENKKKKGDKKNASYY